MFRILLYKNEELNSSSMFFTQFILSVNSKKSIEVIEFTDIKEILFRLKRTDIPFNLFILSNHYQSPVNTGTIIQCIKAEDKYKNTPIFIVCERVTIPLKSAYTHLGVDKVLTLPSTIFMNKQLIRECIHAGKNWNVTTNPEDTYSKLSAALAEKEDEY